MAQSNSSFFDVLIDRLVDDVRREFEAELESGAPSKGKPAPVEAHDDLVSKMIGFRSRRADVTSGQIPALYRAQGSAKFASDAVRHQMNSTATPTEATPSFMTSEAQVAFTVASKAGAKFTVQDMTDGGLSADAMKRERRRVLLNLHPDRQPESNRAEAHKRFLEAAEAFSVLASDALTRSQERSWEPEGRPGRAA